MKTETKYELVGICGHRYKAKGNEGDGVAICYLCKGKERYFHISQGDNMVYRKDISDKTLASFESFSKGQLEYTDIFNAYYIERIGDKVFMIEESD